MKYLGDYDNIFETEAWFFEGNMKVLLGYLDWGLGTKGPHSDPTEKFFWVCVFPAMLSRQTFCLKWGKNFRRWLLYYYSYN